MSSFQRLQITSNEIGSTVGTKVLIDGFEIRGIRSIVLNGSHDDCWHCEIEFLPDALEVEVQTILQITKEVSPSSATKPKRILRAREVDERTGLTKSQRERMVNRGDFPRPLKLSDDPKARAVGWLEDAIDCWIMQRVSA